MKNNSIILIALASGFALWVTTNLLLVSLLGIVLCIFITMKFLESIGTSFPLRELILTLMLIQLIICPIITYNYFDNQALYSMDVSEAEYMAIVFSAMCLFSIGLFFPLPYSGRSNILAIVKDIEKGGRKNSAIGLSFIGVGFAAGFLSSWVPPSLSFVFYLLEQFKFIGMFYLFYSNNSLKYFWLVFVFGIYTYQTVIGGIFINLFTWTLLTFLIIGFQFKLRFGSKVLFFLAGVFLTFFIQTFKKEYREIAWDESTKIYSTKYDSKGAAFVGVATEKVRESEDIYEYGNLNRFVSRLNQGWILTRVFNHVPLREPYARGETIMSDLYASLVPRFLDPTKTVSAGKEGAEKFARFTGRQLLKRTRMTISILGDGYVNFGPIGGIFFMFCFGLFLNIGIYTMIRLSRSYPTLLLWIPFVFAISMRSGNEFVAILNYITKSAFVVFVIFLVFKKYFAVKRA